MIDDSDDAERAVVRSKDLEVELERANAELSELKLALNVARADAAAHSEAARAVAEVSTAEVDRLLALLNRTNVDRRSTLRKIASRIRHSAKERNDSSSR